MTNSNHSINHFKSCQTLDEAKRIYYKLAMIFHPDQGGTDQQFQELNNQFHNFKPGTEKFEGEAGQFNSEQYAELIEMLMKLPNIVIEITGSFIWLSGDTMANKDAIKEIPATDTMSSARWARKKKMWYFSPAGYKKFRKGEFSMDQIRTKYGSNKMNTTRAIA